MSHPAENDRPDPLAVAADGLAQAVGATVTDAELTEALDWLFRVHDGDSSTRQLGIIRQHLDEHAARLAASEHGCCTLCHGTGINEGACWDCRGTGHPHQPDPGCRKQ